MNFAIIVLADNETHEGLGRVVNAMAAAYELNEAGDDIRVVFDVGGPVEPTQIIEPTTSGHRSVSLLRAHATTTPRPSDVTDRVRQADVPFLDGYKRHAASANSSRTATQMWSRRRWRDHLHIQLVNGSIFAGTFEAS